MSHDQTVTLARPTTAEVEREELSASKGRWKIVVDGHESEMTYSRASPTLIIIDHTAVNDALRGRGVGQVLVARAVEDARREGFRIIPLCPFAKAQFERHAEWQDVLST
jgi:predicted GNAT family acetyltransferase